MINNSLTEVWIFNGAGSRFSSGVFSSKQNAEAWILEHKLSGVLTLYPLNQGVYDWAIKEGFFNPTEDTEKESSFVQKFTSASQEHYHYEDGLSD